MVKKWVKKERPAQPNIIEQQRIAVEDSKQRAAFFARRAIQTAQPRLRTQQ